MSDTSADVCAARNQKKNNLDVSVCLIRLFPWHSGLRGNFTSVIPWAKNRSEPAGETSVKNRLWNLTNLMQMGIQVEASVNRSVSVNGSQMLLLPESLACTKEEPCQ